MRLAAEPVSDSTRPSQLTYPGANSLPYSGMVQYVFCNADILRHDRDRSRQRRDFRVGSFSTELGFLAGMAALPGSASNGLSLPKLFNRLTAKRRCRSPDQGSPFWPFSVDDKFERARSLNWYFGNRRAAQILIICRLTCVRQMPTMRVPYAASLPASAISRSEPGAREGDRSSAFLSNCE